MMQKLPYKDFIYTTTSLYSLLFTRIYRYDYNDICKNRTKQLSLKPNKIKINDNELGYREREKGRARTQKLILGQNNKTEYMVL